MLMKPVGQNPFPGEGFQQGPRIPWYESTYTNTPTAAGIKPQELGETWFDEGFGNQFQYVYLDIASRESPATISAGVLLTPSTPGTDTVASSLTDAASSITYGIVLTTGGLTVNAEVGNFCFLVDLGMTFMIESNTATHLIFSQKGTIFGNNTFDPNYLPSIPTPGTAVSIIRPFHMGVCDATHPPTGVLLNDAVEGQEVIIQVRGLAYILGNNSGTTTAVNIPAVTDAAGIIQGGSASAAALGDAMILPQIAYDGANLLIPCYFKGNGF